MKKKILALVLCIALVASLAIGLVACNNDDVVNELILPAYDVVEVDYSDLTIPSDFKIGMICLHDKNSTYDKNFIEAMEDTQKKFGLSNSQVIIKTGIPETTACYNAAVELVNMGCDIIFADSFGHEEYMIQAAKAYPNVMFAHATGVKAITENLPNYVNAFASIYEGRYLAGIAAGMKLNEMINAGTITAAQAKMGYVGAYTYAEVISGYTSFYLGAKSVCPTVTMDVTFTGSWYDETAENNAAKSLIAAGCKLISQHADSMGAPNACEEAGVPNVSYNGSTIKAAPNTFIVSSRINWSPYYEYLISSVVKDDTVAKNWTGTIQTGSVVLTNLGGNAAAAGTVDAIVAARTGLANGTIKVFNTANFTVGGERVEDSKPISGVDYQAIKTENGITFFDESDYRSAPYFELEIDGITLLDRVYG